ncbi:MAG: FAD binding domain-containing protein [Candidatus Omnitrophica bacterium]|nr:FAD binding domain-containing protein [Candidatus Omnitrophota bacterium]
MLLNPLTLHVPKNALEAARLFKELEDVKVLAGGTFLLNSLKLLKTKGTKTAKNVLSLAKATDLKGASLNGGVLTIKAMTTITELFENPLLADNLAVLRTVCRNISTNPIRNMATVGGNLTCRYTWTEMGAVMIALDARMHFLAPDGKESAMPAEDFFKNAARAEQLFTHVTINHDPKSTVAYRRVRKTMHVDVPLLAVCAHTTLSGKQWANTRVAVNNGTAFAQRDYTLEKFLNTSRSTPDLGARALDHLTKDIYDTRSSEYKQHMFRVSLKSAIEEIAKG